MKALLSTSINRAVLRPKIVALVFVLSACLAFTIEAPADEAKDSIKEMKELRKRIEKARESLEDNKKEFVKTLEIYNAIFQEQKNLTGPYKKLIKAVDGLQKRREKNREVSEAMQAKSEEFFTNWEAKLATYTNENLRQKSQERLEATRTKYDELGQATEQARGEYDAILTSLNEQVTFLGTDLSPDAVAALKDEAAKVNEQSTALLQKADEFIAAIKEREAALAK